VVHDWVSKYEKTWSERFEQNARTYKHDQNLQVGV
jgi:hypothetical protein